MNSAHLYRPHNNCKSAPRFHHSSTGHRHSEHLDYTFHVHLFAKIGEYIHSIYDIVVNNRNFITDATRIRLSPLKYRYLSTYRDWFNYIETHDPHRQYVHIYTDGSVLREYGNSYAGLGLYIEAPTGNAYYWEALGHQTIQYAELLALNRVLPIFRSLKLQSQHIFVYTDSSICFKAAHDH